MKVALFMVTMDQISLRVALLTPAVVISGATGLVVGCGAGPDEVIGPAAVEPGPDPAEGSGTVPRSPATPAPARGLGQALAQRVVEADAAATAEREAAEASPTRHGTDSMVASAPPVPPELAASLTLFSRQYLGYDHRLVPSQRLESARHLLTPELFAVVATPLPGALAEQLAAEELTVTVESVSVEGLEELASGGGVYRILATTTETRRLPGSPDPVVTESSASLIVVVGASGLIEDVR